MGDRVDRFAFDSMQHATADKTAVDLLGSKSRTTKDDVHNMLMVAGFTPGLGNIADAADALLYAAQGEFGNAGLSVASMIPFVGQTVAAKKALKLAKESGEKMVTLYRGVDKWYPGKMVNKGKFIGGGEKSQRMSREGIKDYFYTAERKVDAEAYVKNQEAPLILEFQVPKSYVEKFATRPGGNLVGKERVGQLLEWGKHHIIFEEGLPKEFLTKVHK